jgi:hypothetical protein
MWCHGLLCTWYFSRTSACKSLLEWVYVAVMLLYRLRMCVLLRVQSKLASLAAEAQTAQAAATSSFEWRGIKAPVSQERVRVPLHNAAELAATLESAMETGVWRLPGLQWADADADGDMLGPDAAHHRHSTAGRQLAIAATAASALVLSSCIKC